MRRIWVILVAMVFMTVGVATQVAQANQAKEKKAGAMKEERWSGLIQRSNKDNSTIVVRRGNVEKTVVYDGSTKWTKGTKQDSAEMGEFKDGVRVIVLGKYDEKGRLVATTVNLRPPR